MQQVFKNARINNQITDLLVRDGIIAAIGRLDLPGTDLDGAHLFAGLIDIHTHGAMGQDCVKDDIHQIAAFELSHGITAFCPTTMSAPLDQVAAATNRTPNAGADFLGYHMEGPFLSPAYCGAQNPNVL